LGLQQAIYWPELSSLGIPVRDIASLVFYDTEADGMPKEDNNPLNRLTTLQREEARLQVN
jgi:hypothetical protein